MPINPSLPLAVQAPQFKSFADAAREAAAFQTQQRQADQNLQIGQQQIQMNSQRMAEAADAKARELKDREEADKINKYFQESGGDLDKTYELALKGGVSADRALKLKETGIQVKQQLQQMNDADLKRTAEKHARIAQYITSVRDAPPEARPQMYQAALTKAVSEGDIDQATAAKMLQAGVPGDQDLDTMLATYGGPGAPLTAELARREAARLKEETDRKERETNRVEAYSTFSSVSDQDSYTEWRNSLKPSIRGEYPNKYDPKTVPDLVRRKARTVAQQDAIDKPVRDTSLSEVELANIQALGESPDATPEQKAAGEVAKRSLQIKRQQEAAGRVPKTPSDPKAKEAETLQKTVDSLESKKNAALAEIDKYTEMSRNAGAELDSMRDIPEEERDNVRVRKLRADLDKANSEVKKQQGIFNSLRDQQVAAQARKQKLYQNDTTGPKVGDIQEGYRFKGGDPGNQANWEKVR